MCNWDHERDADRHERGDPVTAVGNFTFNVPNNQYSQFAIFGSGGSGNSTLTITLTYATGSPTVLTGVTLPDWYSGAGTSAAGAAGTYFALTPRCRGKRPTASRAAVIRFRAPRAPTFMESTWRRIPPECSPASQCPTRHRAQDIRSRISWPRRERLRQVPLGRQHRHRAPSFYS